MEIDERVIDELRMGAMTAIDGLWFLNVEKKFGFEAALEMDLEVWRAYGIIQLKRLARRLGLELDPDNPPDLATINLLMETLCRVEGTRGEGQVLDENSCAFKVYKCAWWENLRRSGREEIVPCDTIDENTFEYWLEVLDPTLEMEMTHSLPRGDDYCAWTLKRKQA